jgi:Ca-activated chloride channel family protein
MNLTFAHPGFLLAGAALAALVVALGVRLDRRRSKALASFNARSQSSLSRPRRLFKRGLLALGVFSCCAALARPQRGFRDEEVQKRGVDLLFAVDVSRSMLAPDLKPDRLTRAKLAIEDLLPRVQGDRLGLIAFAGEAFLQVPLTFDDQMFAQSLSALDTSIIPRGGTDLGGAIAAAREALKSEPRNDKLLVLLTDGEDLEAHALDEARAAAREGLHIYTVGVGTGAGELVPLPGGGFAREQSGAFVRSHLDEPALRQIAAATGGAYRLLGADGRGLDSLYDEALAKLPKEEHGSRLRRTPIERFQWPLGFALICLALEPLLSERRRRGSPARAAARPAALAMAAGLLLAATGARASVREAEKDYRAGKFAQAADEYRKAAANAPEDARLHYNLGAAAYKKGDYAEAQASFERALRQGKVELQQKSYYDLGNAQFRGGEATVAAKPESTIADWKRAITSYDGALALDPKDADAQFNRELVKKKLAELEKKQHQDKSKQDQSKQDQKDQQQQAKNQQDKDQPGKSQPQNGQGQQAKPQPGEGQQAKPQPGQGQEQQAKQDPGARDGQQKSAQQDHKGAGQPASAGQRDERDDQAAPGKMSRNDARALLDALKGDDRMMGLAGDQRAHTDDEPVQKDW